MKEEKVKKRSGGKGVYTTPRISAFEVELEQCIASSGNHEGFTDNNISGSGHEGFTSNDISGSSHDGFTSNDVGESSREGFGSN